MSLARSSCRLRFAGSCTGDLEGAPDSVPVTIYMYHKQSAFIVCWMSDALLILEKKVACLGTAVLLE